MKVSDFRYLAGVTLSICCLLPQLLAAPAAVASNNEDNRDKRSGEVIFFENSNDEENSLKKRSDDWSMPKSSVENDVEDGAFINSLSNDLRDKGEKQVLGELEKWAFDEALNFLVDKLIAEAYEEALDDYYVYDDTTPLVAEPIAEHNNPTTSETPESQQQFDDEADALAALIAKQNYKSAPQPKAAQHPIEMKARGDESYDIDIKPAVDVNDEVSSESSYDDGDDQLTMDTADEPSMESEVYGDGEKEDSNEEDAYSIEKILEYFDYLSKLRGMEDSFRNNAKGFEQMELGEQSELGQSSKPQIRKRRSIPEDWIDSRATGGQGVCFTAEEARELKDLLVGLAKDRMALQELSSYLMDEEASSPIIDNGYPEREEASSKQLENLAYRLNQQQRGAYRQQVPQSKRAYEFSPYDFAPRN